jgi:hypothetical protein
MTDSGIRRAPAARALASALVVLSAAAGGLAGAGRAAADSTPSPLPTASSSAPALQLPVIPSLLDTRLSGCTRASGTVMHTVPWAQQSLGLDRAHQLATGTGVTVAVIDTGVSTAAPALAGRVRTVGGATAGKDCVGHGTFVAGIIAAAPTPGTGFAGVAPAAGILAVRGVDKGGSPSEALVADGIRAATDAGAKVIDVSLSFPKTTAALTSALAYAAAHDVLVVAPGVPDDLLNTSSAIGDQAPSVAYWPAARPGVLSVVDVDITGARPTSAVNPVRADLSAPGQGVTGIGPLGRGHFLADGPSVAAAFVSGAAALLRSYQPRLTAAQVAARLTASAYPDPVPRLDPYAALSAVLPTARPPGRVADSAIHLHPTRSDPGPARRAYTVLGGSALATVVLVAAVLLARRRRARGPQRTAGS